MDLDIKDKVIVVTGAARGIGRALALGLAAEGARVGVLARDRERAQLVVDEIAALPVDAPKALALVADVSDEDAVRRAAAEVDTEWGRLDGLINNAGLIPANQRVLDTDADTVRQVFDSNVLGCFLTTKHFAPLMIRGGGGRIVFVSSGVGVQAGPGAAAYGASKAAVNLLSNVVHQELADQGVRTTALAPGLTITPGVEAAISDERLTQVAASYPGGRLGQPEDLVGLVAFLCSDLATHISGSVLFVRPPV